MEKDVFGRSGDFITAPEISQLFGEMIALNFVIKLHQHPVESLHLIEFGPGRGTLMSDMLRTFQAFPHIWQKLKRCSLIEVSPHLKQLQKQKLSQFPQLNLEWIQDLNQLNVVPDSTPLFVAQEFFDALPVHVFKKSKESKWMELLVNYDQNKGFGLIEVETPNIGHLRLQHNFPDWPVEETLELSPQSWSIVDRIRQLLSKTTRGEGIFIDYGKFGPSPYSLRAIYRHEFCPIFDHLGEADLSVDVDFQSLMHYLGPENKYQFSTQSQFLIAMGIKERLEQLKKKDKSSYVDTVESSVNRLISEKEMGRIYKVLQFSRK